MNQPPPLVQIVPVLSQNITMDILSFCAVTGIGQTTVRAMIGDGRLQSFRVGRKKILVVVQSYLDLLAKQAAAGVPEYEGTEKAVAARKAKRAEGVTLESLGLVDGSEVGR